METILSRALDIGMVIVLLWSLILLLQGRAVPSGFGFALLAAVIVQLSPRLLAF